MVGTITETDIMFKYDDARAFLRDNAYPYYANKTTAVSKDWRDKLFLALIGADADFFDMTVKYRGEKLISASINGQKIF